MDIKKLCEDSHRISKEKGFLDPPRSFANTCNLIHSELSEAIEEFRANRGIGEVYYECTFKEDDGSISVERVAREDLERAKATEGKYGRGRDFIKAKPCGIPSELADVLIRIAQHCGTHEWDLAGENFLSDSRPAFDDLIASCHLAISNAYAASITQPSTFGSFYWYSVCFFSILEFCKEENIDIDEVVYEKQAYNEGREYRHGGKKI